MRTNSRGGRSRGGGAAVRLAIALVGIWKSQTHEIG